MGNDTKSRKDRADWPLNRCSHDLQELGPQEAYDHFDQEHTARAAAAYDIFLAFREAQ